MLSLRVLLCLHGPAVSYLLLAGYCQSCPRAYESAHALHGQVWLSCYTRPVISAVRIAKEPLHKRATDDSANMELKAEQIQGWALQLH